MRILLVLSATLLLSVANATAGADPGLDGLGIYFDIAGQSNCSTAALYSPVSAYLIATNVTASSGISAWECRVMINDAYLPFPLTYVVLAGGVNTLTRPMFMVNLGVPLPRASEMVLMSISTIYAGGSVLFGLAPCNPSSFGGLSPGYAVGNNPGTLKPLTPSSSVPWPGVPYGYGVAGINAGPGCPVASESSSWSGVKALYR